MNRYPLFMEYAVTAGRSPNAVIRNNIFNYLQENVTCCLY